jgi:hypothetical protein
MVLVGALKIYQADDQMEVHVNAMIVTSLMQICVHGKCGSSDGL